MTPAMKNRSPLSVVWRRIDDLILDPGNPRAHGKRQIRRLADSIATFGFNVPILVDRTLRVVAGHGRLLACRELGWSEVPTIRLDHLGAAEIRAFMIADNRLAEQAEWDEDLLAEQLRILALDELDFSLAATGFELGEIELRIGARGAAAKPAGARPRRRCRTRPGDVWLMGRHRLHCGDAEAACAMLAGAETPVVVFAADPRLADAILAAWQARTGAAARHAASGRAFGAAAGRQGE
jgi:hypothetical protein